MSQSYWGWIFIRYKLYWINVMCINSFLWWQCQYLRQDCICSLYAPWLVGTLENYVSKPRPCHGKTNWVSFKVCVFSRYSLLCSEGPITSFFLFVFWEITTTYLSTSFVPNEKKKWNSLKDFVENRQPLTFWFVKKLYFIYYRLINIINGVI